MKKVIASDVLPNEEYLKVRDVRRKEIIALKNRRRISVGPRLTFTFENRNTVIYQIQEMMRVENIKDPPKIQNEIDVYNDLIPDPNCLSATLFIEISDNGQIRDILDSMQGLDAKDIVYLRVGGETIAAEFEPGHSKEDRISAVHYVRFRLSVDQAQRFRDSQVEIHVQHPNYRVSAALTSDQKKELAKDLLQ
jgi:Protein of unknown function (DUF3501)